MCTNFGFNCHPERPCKLEQEWVSLWMRLFSYLRRKPRQSLSQGEELRGHVAEQVLQHFQSSDE